LIAHWLRAVASPSAAPDSSLSASALAKRASAKPNDFLGRRKNGASGTAVSGGGTAWGGQNSGQFIGNHQFFIFHPTIRGFEYKPHIFDTIIIQIVEE
jgi:hypothetical protein